MAPPFLLPILMVLAAFGVVLIITPPPPAPRPNIEIHHRGPTCRIQSCVDSNPQLESQLRNNAQEALRAIGSNRMVTASNNRANRGQHVFNNGVIGFPRSVLQDVLRDVGGYEQLDNLVHDLIPLSQSVQNLISTMVARFSSDEFYVDFNADMFGEYVRELRKALVAFLKADTSPNQNDRYKIQETRRRINLIAREMVNHEVYVDPMARDRWLIQNQNRHENYNLVRDALKEMFRNILQIFQKASDKIRVFRRTNNWSWESDLK